jgi:hypothetical protein
MAYYIYKARPVRERYVGRRYHYHPFAFTGFLLAVAGLVLMAVGIGTNFYYEQGDVGQGMFRACVKDNYDDSCSGQINRQCRYENNGRQVLTTNIERCEEFNAIRALAVVGTILAGIAVLLMLCTCCSRYVFYEYVSSLCFLAAICGLVSFIMGIVYKTHTNFDSWAFGYSFYIFMGGWIAEFLASMCYFSWGKTVYA